MEKMLALKAETKSEPKEWRWQVKMPPAAGLQGASLELGSLFVGCAFYGNFRASGSVRRHPLPFLSSSLPCLPRAFCRPLSLPLLPILPIPSLSLSLSLSLFLCLFLSPCLLPVHAPLQKKGTLIRTSLLSHFLALSLSLSLCLSVSLFLSLCLSLSRCRSLRLSLSLFL